MKWAEGVQIRRLAEAEEIRRQQNNFIDITSHEMRNPLSAIIQCADGISSSLSEYQAEATSQTTEMAEAIMSSIDNADTILLCAQHQKSVVDDILTLSKLDSDLLHITPVTTEPVEVVRQALKMFDCELQANDIKMEFHIDESLRELQVDRVMLDSSRLLQILINLLTNAIKFTKGAARRSIFVSIFAYLTPPSDSDDIFDYIPTKTTRSEITLGKEWGSGEVIYLRFEVRDTGCGLTPDEKKLLFMRFSQASPRTHVQYGGSGLGLFISRQLTELHGGKIGVASKAGVGSTFAFYVQSRKSDSDTDMTMTNTQLQSSLQATVQRAKSVRKSLKAGPISNLLHVTVSTPASAGTSPAASAPAPSPVVSNSLSKSKLTTTTSSPSSYHILIVEDNLVNQKVLATQIRKQGCTVYVANHGGEALALLKESRFYKGRKYDGKELSVILMDLEMPVMDGLTCVRRIREMQAEGEMLGHVPIIAVTANARGEQIAAAKDSGMVSPIPLHFRLRIWIHVADVL
jgi:signal transduction histidine kinase/CheY-like chemotaxis protein